MFTRRRRDRSNGRGRPGEPDDLLAVSSRSGAGETVIGSQTRFTGRLRGEGAVVVRGFLVGEIDIRGGLKVTTSGRIEADVDVRSADLCGEARGSMRATERVLVQETGFFEGRMATPVIEMHPGGILRGRTSIAGMPPGRRRKPRR